MSEEILVGDIGGTNARFAVASESGGRMQLSAVEVYRCAEFPSLEAALRHYLKSTGHRVSAAAVAVAGPVHRGNARLTNIDWEIGVDTLREAGHLSRAAVINDFEALGHAAAHLGPEDVERVGPKIAGDERGSIAILGPGTGFGVTALVRRNGVCAVAATEGGHVSFCPQDELEVEIWRYLQHRFGRVSVERILCGSGLVNLCGAIAQIEGQGVAADDPAEISRMAFVGDALCARTLDRFCMILGSVAGDFALAFGATGGVIIAGGMALQLRSWIECSQFRARFDDKGRMSGLTRRIPTDILIQPYAALIGAAWAVNGGAA